MLSLCHKLVAGVNSTSHAFRSLQDVAETVLSVPEDSFTYDGKNSELVRMHLVVLKFCNIYFNIKRLGNCS